MGSASGLADRPSGAKSIPTFRVIQVSDMHLSATHPFFTHNWNVVLEQVNAAKPELVIATGDLTLNGPKDFKYVQQQLKRIEAPLLTLPGNRDVGNNLPNRRDNYSVSEALRKRYRRYFGDDYWSVDKGTWRLIGLNALLFGSGFDSERQQLRWLESALREAEGRRIALFLHKPLFVQTPKEKRVTQASVMPQPRARLLKIMAPYDVRLLASGHLHEYRVRRHGRTRFVWAPATAYIVNDPKRGGFGGRRRVGYMEYRFQGREARCVLQEPPDLINHDLSGWFRDGIDVYQRNIRGPYRGLP
ncbi:MAG: metallophosphoesterase family protein [Acidiferrobacterales bacterium]